MSPVVADFSRNPGGWLKRLGFTVLEFFLPRLCLFCGAAVGEEAAGAVCPECEGQIEWVESPLCSCCGRMFAHPGGRRPRSAATARRSRRPLPGPGPRRVYDGPVATAIKRFKFGRQDGLSAGTAALAAAPRLSGTGGRRRPAARRCPCTPGASRPGASTRPCCWPKAFPEVPVGREAARPGAPHRAPGGPQPQGAPGQRQRGLCRAPDPRQVKGKNILLIDDLFTTGSTVRECARVLRRAGARRVEVLTVARVKHE